MPKKNENLKINYFLIYDGRPKSGINDKIVNQLIELEKLGFMTRLILVSPEDVEFPLFSNIELKKINNLSKYDLVGRIIRSFIINKYLKRTLDSLNYGDILYIRGSEFNFLYYPINFLKIFRKGKVVAEHQTIELKQFLLSKSFLAIFREILFGRLIRSQYDAIIGVTEEITRYEVKFSGNHNVPNITIGNGIKVNSVILKPPVQYDGKNLNLICVANINRWHGLDRLLKGLAVYKGDVNIVLHIAGDGPEINNLKILCGCLRIENQVIFHGFITGKTIDDLYHQSHIAIGSLGIHRVGLKEASILKAREYSARGIPFILGHSDPDFPEDFPYILKFPSNDNPIDIGRILLFTKGFYLDPNNNMKLRQYAENNLDWSIKIKILKKFLCKL